MNWAQGLLLAGGGLLAGGINAIAGGGSLISFPLLVALGYPPLSANLTNTVGMIPGYLGATVAYRRELAAQRHRLPDIAIACGAGAILGALLVVSTPASLFARVAPWLIAVASALMAAQGWLTRRLRGGGRERQSAVAGAAFLVGAYGGYFNAGLGVVILAAMGLVVTLDLQGVNALKGFMSLVVSALAALVFLVLGTVVWPAAAVLAVTSFVGGQLGGGLARRIRDAQLRAAIVVSGLAVSVYMLV